MAIYGTQADARVYSPPPSPLEGQASARTQPSSIHGLINELSSPLDRLATLANRLRSVGDALEGSRPEKVAGDSPETEPHCFIDALSRKTQRFHRTVQDCEAALERIEKALGGH